MKRPKLCTFVGAKRPKPIRSAGFLHHMDWLKQEACLQQGGTSCGTFRCAATACTSALTGILTRACRPLLVRLWDHSKDSCMSLFHPFANCKTHETMTVALVFESHLSRGRPPTAECCSGPQAFHICDLAGTLFFSQPK